jgi:hypothetical protein
MCPSIPDRLKPLACPTKQLRDFRQETLIRLIAVELPTQPRSSRAEGIRSGLKGPQIALTMRSIIPPSRTKAPEKVVQGATVNAHLDFDNTWERPQNVGFHFVPKRTSLSVCQHAFGFRV